MVPNITAILQRLTGERQGPDSSGESPNFELREGCHPRFWFFKALGVD
jgi:hypothetical protein